MPSSSRPVEIVLRIYQVGFGDCFLLTFRYDPPEHDRHILIDFGSTETPDGAPKRSDMFRQIARDIQAKSKGKLHAVIATHRHADHINGFATKESGDSGDIIRQCSPDLVLQPWTEDPAAPENPLAGTEEDHHRLFQRLATLHAFSRTVKKDLSRLRGVRGCSGEVLKGLDVLAANNGPSNPLAVENLRKMGKPVFLSYGEPAKLDLPGVGVHVLGPPTLQQSKGILRQRESYADEFWQFLQAVDPILTDPAPLFDSPATSVAKWPPQHTRWLIRRLTSLRSEQLLEMVRTLDNVLNNTSLILLFEVGDQKLLFPGDAQWENWSYALQQPGNDLLLKGATLYKVGHHGSRNATPRSLLKLIRGDRLLSVVSTKPGRHGHAEDHTEVPRATLVQEFQKHQFFSTQGMGWVASPDGAPPSKVFTLTPCYDAAPTSAARPS